MRPWIAVSGALIAAGLGLFLYKVMILGYPLSTAEEPGTWRVDFVVSVTGRGARTTVDIPLPRTSSYQRLLTEEVKSEQMRFSITEGDGDRHGRWSGRLDGTSVLTYEVTFDASAVNRALPATDAGGKYPPSAKEALEVSPGIDSTDPAVAELSSELRLDTSNKALLAQQVYEFVAREIGAVRGSADMDAVTVIREGRGTELGRARLFCALTRANGIPCRVLAGIPLSTGRQQQFRYWNEAYLRGAWVPVDVVGRHLGALPADRLSLGATSGAELVTATNASAVSFRFDVQAELETYAELVRRQLAASQHAVDRASLLFLPVQSQHVLRILLLVPLGALAMCVLRNIVGLKTFGMFMPVLIALAFTGTGLAWGTFFLAVIVGFALLSRVWITRLYLLLAARIAFILTLVILLMTALFVIGDKIGMPSSGVGVFPFVIMTMIVERITVGLEEEGAANTLRRIAATLAAIYLTYTVVQAHALQTIFLVYPELLLVILGLLVAVGRYTGYRLSELIRFRALVDAPPAVPPL